MNHPCSPEAKLDRIERRREHIRTVSIYGEVWDMFLFRDYFYCKVLDIFGDYCYCKVWDMVEERALQLAPPPGHSLTSILFVPFLLECFALYSSILSLYLCPDAPTNPKTLQAKPNLKPCTTQPPVHHPATKTSQDPCGPHCTSPPSSFSCASYLFHFLLPAEFF